MVKIAESRFAADVLDDLVVGTPCPMDWDLMEGDDVKRFCSRCEKVVYDLTAMSREEALQLVGEGEPKVCARFYRRPDGTVVTAECTQPRQRNAGRRFQFSIATLVALLTSSAALFASAPWIGRKLEPLVQRWFGKQPTMTLAPPVYLMGDIAIAPQPPLTTMPCANPPVTYDPNQPVDIDIWEPSEG